MQATAAFAARELGWGRRWGRPPLKLAAEESTCFVEPVERAR
jgi:hypothetical protein